MRSAVFQGLSDGNRKIRSLCVSLTTKEHFYVLKPFNRRTLFPPLLIAIGRMNILNCCLHSSDFCQAHPTLCMAQCKYSPNLSSLTWQKTKSSLFFVNSYLSFYLFLARQKYASHLSFQVILWRIFPDPLSIDPSAYHLRVSSMCQCIVHGQRSAPRGNEGGSCICSSCVVRGIQSFIEYRPKNGCREQGQLGRSGYKNSSLQGRQHFLSFSLCSSWL